MPAAVPPFQRFHETLSQGGPNGCWVWNGASGQNGYGQIKSFGKIVSAHRFAFELYKGPIPEGQEILHSCDNKLCVNPDHLRAGTHAENMAEAGERDLMPRGRAHHSYGRRNLRPNQAHRVRVLGRTYLSQKEAERALGLGSGTVRYWIKNKPERAQIISKGMK